LDQVVDFVGRWSQKMEIAICAVVLWLGISLSTLRRQVSIEQVPRHLGHLDPLRGFGPQRRGPCPLHDPPSHPHRSFSVHPRKGVFRCFHPECQAQGNTLDLWAAYHRLPVGQAAESLANIFASHLTSAEKSATENKPVTENR
jgi:DNA primase